MAKQSSQKTVPLHPTPKTLCDYRATYAVAMKASLWCVAGAVAYFFALMLFNGGSHGSSEGYTERYGGRITLEKGSR